MHIYIRNLKYAVRHPARTWRVNLLCRKHVQANPACEWCGGTEKVQAHHKVPIWANEVLADDPDNLISLCMARRCHLIIGHMGNFATKYLVNVDEICEQKDTSERKLTPSAEHSSIGPDIKLGPGGAVCIA